MASLLQAKDSNKGSFEGVHRDSLVAQTTKSLPAMWETQVRSLEKEMATPSSILAWKIPWMEGPGELQSTGSQRFGNN